MKILFIGGSGNISTECTLNALEKGYQVYHVNRGVSGNTIENVQVIKGDINKTSEIKIKLEDHHWDVVVNFIAFTPEDIERDYLLFRGKTKQYVFISSASCYQTPLSHPVITESTPLHNPTWDYSHHKILCERRLWELYLEEGWPMTIVRPSHTYDTVIPIAIGGFKEWTTAQRILDGKPIIIHGNGEALWVVTHSKDFAKGFVPLLGMPKAIGQAFHITSDEKLTWNNIYNYLGRALGREINPVYIPTNVICAAAPIFRGSLDTDKSSSVIFDNAKIKSYVPDFQATIPFHEGIKKTVDWFFKHKDKQVINEEKNLIIDDLIVRYE